MAVPQGADLFLDGKPFMLQRSGQMRGRAWRRTGQVNAPGRRTQEAARYGTVPDEIDHPEVFDDLSGPYGEAYRRTSNAVHWSENLDLRRPGEAIHCQAMRFPGAAHASYRVNANYVADVPPDGTGQPIAGTGDVLVSGNGYITRYTPTNLAAEASQLIGSVLVASGNWGNRPALFGSYVYVGNLDGSGFGRIDADGGGFTQSALPGALFTVAGNRLWRFWGPGRKPVFAQSIADAAPASVLVGANWSATLAIGDSFLPIQDALDLNDQVFIGKPDGLYAGDQSGTFYNVLSHLKTQVDADNCRDLTVYDNGVVVPHIGGLLWFYPSDQVAQAREIWRGGQLSNRSPVRGRIRCTTALGPWLYAGLWTGSQSYVLAGRDASPGLPYPWTVMQRLPHVGKIARIHFDGITAPTGGNPSGFYLPNRCWVATEASVATNGTAPLYYFQVPLGNESPLSDLSFSPNYVGSARLDLGAADWEAPATAKVWRHQQVWGDNALSGVRFADVYRTVDRGQRQLLGRVQDSPLADLFFPHGAGNFVTGQSIEIGLESFTATASETPVYRALVTRGALLPDSADVISAAVRIADGLRDRRGRAMRSGALQIEELREMARPWHDPVTLIDLAGATQYVKVQPPIEESEVWQEGEEYPEVMATVRMAVLAFTTNQEGSQALYIPNSLLTHFHTARF